MHWRNDICLWWCWEWQWSSHQLDTVSGPGNSMAICQWQEPIWACCDATLSKLKGNSLGLGSETHCLPLKTWNTEHVATVPITRTHFKSKSAWFILNDLSYKCTRQQLKNNTTGSWSNLTQFNDNLLFSTLTGSESETFKQLCQFYLFIYSL